MFASSFVHTLGNAWTVLSSFYSKLALWMSCNNDSVRPVWKIQFENALYVLLAWERIYNTFKSISIISWTSARVYHPVLPANNDVVSVAYHPL